MTQQDSQKNQALPRPVRANSPSLLASLIALARAKAAKYNLYPDLVCAVAEQESAWNPWAMRYELNFFKKYVVPLIPTKGLTWTEAEARAISWGLCQVMGQVAREHGFDRPYLSELCDPEAGLEIGCKVLAAKLAAAEGNVTKALLLWNGGGNADYPAQVLARAEHYRQVEDSD